MLNSFKTDLWARAAFDPGTLTAATLATTAVSGGLSAAGTLAGGSYAKQAGLMQQQAANYQAEQLESNANQAIASGQRQMLETRNKTQLAIGQSTARAAGSGVNTGVGSPAINEGELAQRGSYQALMDMFNGASTATGLRNQAAGVRYTGQMERIGGEEAQTASELAAAGTLAGTAGSMFKSYGALKYPTLRGGTGASL